MSPRVAAQVLVALSIVYGGILAILGFAGSDALTPVAVVGGVTLGVLWALYGVFVARGGTGE